MRILIVSDTTGRMRGGVPAETRQLIAGLRQRGHAVGLFADIPLGEDAAVEHLPMSFPAGASFGAEIRAAVSRFAPDFVHVMSMSSRGVFVLQRALAGRPWLLTCHSIPPSERKLPAFHGNERLHYAGRNLRFLPNTLGWVALLRRGVVPHVVVHSAVVERTALGYGQPRDRTTMIPLACDGVGRPRASLAVRSSAAPRLVTTGGIAHTKGYHDAIAALATVRERHPGLRYQIIGEVRDESYLAHLRSLIEASALHDQVLITPNLPEADKQAALDAADLYLQPSHEEGFCLSYIEAAMAVPRLVGADTGAIALMSRDDAGAEVVPPKRPVELAAAITRLLAKTLPADTMAHRFARLARDFSLGGYLDAHEALYAALRARHAGAGRSA